MAKPLIVIPARYGSERLKGKMLLAETGKPLIQHTYEACLKVEGADVLIATDHEEIEAAAKGFGAEVVMTDPALPSGTLRVAAAAKGREASIVVNCQGDEPEVVPGNISALIEGHLGLLQGSRPPLLSTLACPWPDGLDPLNPNTVKLITTRIEGGASRALYFSRSVLPFPRTRDHRPLMHIGLYAFSPEGLAWFAATEPSSLAVTESLEQLTALEMGESIGVFMVEGAAPGIDTKEDYDAFVGRYRAEH
ncbi:3-deoxy-manno-octulosonate cytidylyltransferase [Parvularcula maris]|uniref:3-deoxy-manno-octulosonate cytidylyltransferase n=1 Tax=Parvularcula maris TaxID=2965077 RepID=A0A9X2L6V8_9PROT|nr:3-deoxy-manno-octulosonate cytidylyltransferase [Parvularcula maris]MCQ8184046.1 3-deoxy-manno-octulosonate cytidylyltransferase [Parvularcula maris]